jgi:hypothetical protein
MITNVLKEYITMHTYPKDGGDSFLQNIVNHLENYTAL